MAFAWGVDEVRLISTFVASPANRQSPSFLGPEPIGRPASRLVNVAVPTLVSLALHAGSLHHADDRLTVQKAAIS
ncbi:hypothetical protein [Nonomuraea sp. GTA35]|uniref:hypothetical protein n=1 Tax=Nonomuraea sp. GTA35 TaxID=1676746 RepID=UPI0035C15543